MSKTPQAPTAQPVITTLRQKLLLIGFGLGLFALGLALLEGALAVFRVGDAYLYSDPFVGFAPGKELFERKTLPGGDEVYATREEKLAFFNAQQFPAEKAPGAYRIFALGGSTTAGRPYDDRVAFCRWLGLYLNAMDPSRDWQAINAGAISYASYRIVVLMKELVRYEPDLFVVYTGHNEFLEERTYSDIIHQNPLLKKLRFWLDRRRFFAVARHGWLSLPGGGNGSKEGSEEGLGAEVDAKLDGWTGLELYRKDEELKRSVIEHFEFNLEQMVRLARSAGADVVFVEPVSNLKDFSPFKSEHPPEMTSTDVDRFARLRDLGRQRLAAGDPAAALDAFAAALEIDPEYAGVHFLSGRAHLARGDHDAALRAFLSAKDFDVAPLRALEPISRLVAETAEREGTPLIDLPALLASEIRERFGHAIFGNEILLDHVHPDVATHSLIAEQLIANLVDRGVARPDPAWTPDRRQEIYDRTVGAFDRRYYAQRDLNLAKVLGWAGKLEEAEAPLVRAAAVLTENPEVHLSLGIVYQKSQRYAEAARSLERAVALAPDLAEAHFNLGVVHGHTGDLDAGVAALRRAVALRPDYPEAHFNLGVLLGRRGAHRESAAALEKALDLKPDAVEAYGHLALAYRGQGRFDDALAAFDQALAADPADAATRTALGVTYGRQGRLDEAVRELERAIAEAPDFAEAHYNLGVVHSQRQAGAEAAAAFRRAIEIDPEHLEAHNNLGIYHAGQGELETARRHLVRAIEIDPGYADAYFNLGIVYDSAGLPEQATTVLTRAVELDPGTPRFHFALAMLLHAGGRSAEAREHFAAAREGGIETPPEILQQMGTGR